MVDNGGLDKGKPCSIASKLDVASPISRNGHMFFCLFGLRLKTRLGILKESQHAHAIERVVPGSMCDNGGWQQKFTLSRSSHLGVPSVCAPFFAGI